MSEHYLIPGDFFTPEQWRGRSPHGRPTRCNTRSAVFWKRPAASVSWTQMVEVIRLLDIASGVSRSWETTIGGAGKMSWASLISRSGEFVAARKRGTAVS